MSKIGRMIGRPPCCCFKRVDSADVLLRTCAISHYSQKTAQKSSSHIAPELITQTKLLLTHHFAQKENASDFDSSFGTQARYRFHHEGRDVFFLRANFFEQKHWNQGGQLNLTDLFWRLDLYIVGKTKNKDEKTSRKNKVETVFTSCSFWLCDCRTLPLEKDSD